MSKSNKLKAVLNKEQKYAILGTSHHDCISRNLEKFIQTSLNEQIFLRNLELDIGIIHL